MAEQWFYRRDGVKSGPVSLGDLRRLAASGGLSPQDQIWKEGMFAWVAAGTMKALFASSGQPPAPTVTAGVPPTAAATKVPALSTDVRGNATDRHGTQGSASVPVAPVAVPFSRSGEEKPTTSPAESGSETKQPMKPFWVGLALFLFFPVGFLLLAIHPQLRTRKTWWAAGAAWVLLLMIAPRQPDEPPPPPPTPEAPGKDNDTPRPAPGPVARPGAPGLGDFFTLGEFKYRITEVNTTRRIGKTLFGEFIGEEAPPGAVFVIVSYTIENMGSESQTVLSDDFKMEDGRARTFRPSSKANVALLMESDDKDFLLSELQPGLPRAMKQAFELPEQAIDSTLTVVVPEKGFWARGSVRVQVSAR
jgi:hypothetical protein